MSGVAKETVRALHCVQEPKQYETNKTMMKSQSQPDIGDIGDIGDSKMSENTPFNYNNIATTPPPINSNIKPSYDRFSNSYARTKSKNTDICNSRMHGLESPICFADLLNYHSKIPTNDFDFKINQTFDQFKNSVISTVNANNLRLNNTFEIQKQTIIDEKDCIIKQQEKEIEKLRQKLTDVSFECHELSAKNETLEASLFECRKKLLTSKVVSRAYYLWRIETVKNRFYKQFTNNVLVPFHKRKLRTNYFIKWKLSMCDEMHANYDIVWQKRLETVSSQIIKEYEETLNSLRAQLKETQDQCKLLQKERNDMEQNMKRAFMRGVSALNLEAMSLFNRSMTQSTNDLRSTNTMNQNQNETETETNDVEDAITSRFSMSSNDTTANNCFDTMGNCKKINQHSYNHLLYEHKDNVLSESVITNESNVNEEKPRKQIPDRFRN